MNKKNFYIDTGNLKSIFDELFDTAKYTKLQEVFTK